MTGEEKYFYPKAKKADQQLIQHGIEEHQEAKQLLSELENLKTDDTKWMSKFEELKKSVEHHVQEEETKVFPKTKKALSNEEEQEAAQNIEKEKSKMM